MGTSLLTLPVVQDALQFATAQLANWQDVPARVAADRAAIQGRAAAAQDAGDTQTIARLTLAQQALDGVQSQYLDSSQYLGEVLRAAQLAEQNGQTPDAGVIADAGRLAATIASGLGALASVEQELQDLGANVTVGASGTYVPGWLKWLGLGAGAVWFYRALTKRRRQRQ